MRDDHVSSPAREDAVNEVTTLALILFGLACLLVSGAVVAMVVDWLLKVLLRLPLPMIGS